VLRGGIAACAATVSVGGTAADDAPLLHPPPADAPLAGAGHAHAHDGDAHRHGEAPAPPETRSFAGVAAIFAGSDLPAPVKERAEAVYRRLAAAEAAVHGLALEEVHFHEVGALDSIVDVAGSVCALHLLGIDRVACSPLPAGHGTIRCAHGAMPVPAPATMELLKGCPVRAVDVEAELVTPTGAALAASLSAQFGGLPAMRIEAIGYGAGQRELPFPNVLRVVIGETSRAPAEATAVTLIEANIDDQSPQLYESAVEALFRSGALDVWLTPVIMKKGRPAHTLSVLCRPEDAAALAEVVFRETATLGIRRSRWERECLERDWIEVETPFGSVRVKVGRRAGALRTVTPEYDDCRARAEEATAPLKEVQAAACAAAWRTLTGGGDLA
jgi:hypothetical protein